MDRTVALSLLLLGVCFSVAHCNRVPIPSRIDADQPCDDPMRLTHPHLFTHCRCIYTDYSKWKASFREVPTHQCTSGFVVVETRSRTVTYGKCDNETEERIAECKTRTHTHTVYTIYGSVQTLNQ